MVSLNHQAPAHLDEEYPMTIDITNADDRDLDLLVDILLQPTDIDAGTLSLSYCLDDNANAAGYSELDHS
jgi:hypothetical protein